MCGLDLPSIYIDQATSVTSIGILTAAYNAAVRLEVAELVFSFEPLPDVPRISVAA